MSVGQHTLEMRHTVGTGIMTFTVKAANELIVPQTGDAVIGYGFIAVCIAALRGIMRSKKDSRRKIIVIYKIRLMIVRYCYLR